MEFTQKLRLVLIATVFVLFISCSSSDSNNNDDSTTSCANLPLDSCAQADSCSVESAAKLDTDLKCKIANEAILCRESTSLCGTALTYASDEEGNIWSMSNDCLPSDWSYTDLELKDSEGSSGHNWSACE